MFFDNIKGHNRNIEFLKRIVKEVNISPSFLFYGPEGVGKKKVALEFANYILSYYKDEIYGDKLNEESIRMFEKKVHPDFLMVDLSYQANILDQKEEEQKSIKIDTVRTIIKFAYLAPSFSTKKVIIIDEADKMTIEAQNALLKTLEEPPSSTIIIIVTSKQNLLLPTIVSRCSSVKFLKLSESDVMDILIEKGFDFKKAEILSKISQGSVSLAIKYLELIDLINADLRYGIAAPFIIVSKLLKRQDLREYVSLFLNFINSYIYLGIKKGSVNFDDGFLLIKENKKFMNYIRHNVNYRLILEVSLYKFFRVFNYFKKGVIL